LPNESDLSADWEKSLRRPDERGLQGLASKAGADDGSVLVVPREYNAKDLLQAIHNLEQYIDKNPKGSEQEKRILRALMEQREGFAGLPELRGQHEEQLGGIKRELALAGAPEKDDAFTKVQAEKTLYNEIKGYGDKGRYEPQNEALRSLAGRAGKGRELDLVAALKALQQLQGSAPGAAVGSGGRIGVEHTATLPGGQGRPAARGASGSRLPRWSGLRLEAETRPADGAFWGYEERNRMGTNSYVTFDGAGLCRRGAGILTSAPATCNRHPHADGRSRHSERPRPARGRVFAESATHKVVLPA
jgi:hypothetical protein